MRKKLFLAVICFVIIKVQAQQPAANPFPKTITVSGSAEMEVIPDEIYVNIILREYQKKGQDKKELENLKTDFLNSCKAAGIPDSAISIVSYTGFNNYYWLRRNKKSPDLNASITYQVKFSNSKQMDDLVDKLDDEATQSFDIVRLSHTKMNDYRRQLKIQAVKAAKEKGNYLTEAIGEKLGPAITVYEPDEPSVLAYNNPTTNNIRVRGISSFANSNIALDQVSGGKSTEIDFRKIKLRFVVDVIFALQ